MGVTPRVTFYNRFLWTWRSPRIGQRGTGNSNPIHLKSNACPTCRCEMFVESTKLFWNLFRELLWPLTPLSVYLLAVTWADFQFHLEIYNFPITIVAVLGTVIGLILAFRTNSSYDRWWEARKLWGSIVNDSRTLVRQLCTFLPEVNSGQPSDILRQASYRQAAWCYALGRSLHGQEACQDIAALIAVDELRTYTNVRNVPNAILLRQACQLRQAYNAGHLDSYQFVELERTLLRLTNWMGGCERIRNTTFPTSYSRMVTGMVYLFVFFLPFSLFNVPSPALLFTSLSISVALLLIDRVAVYLQDPFSNRPSGTPVLSLSRTVEINIRQMLNEHDVPELPKPVEGTYYESFSC